MKTIFENTFAYLIGNFMADGSLYLSGRGCRFEFVDGSPYKKELMYSLKHLKRIKQILEEILCKDLPKIRKVDNKFVLKFRSKQLTELFASKFKIFPGKKHRIVDIPIQYKDSDYEESFWRGFLDGDGSIARKTKKISLESMSKNIINSFSNYLIKRKIFFSKYKSARGRDYSHVIVIRSISFRDFAEKIGFSHPLKSKLLSRKLKEKDFHVKNEFYKYASKLDTVIDYTQFFDNSIFIESGRELLLKYGYNKYSRENIQANELMMFLKEQGLKKQQILNEINTFRFKKSKGSMNSVKLPLFFNKDILRIGKFVRIRNGGISFSKRYIEAFNEDFDEILETTQQIFDIKPKFTCKSEPLFCSGVISDLFNKIIKKV